MPPRMNTFPNLNPNIELSTYNFNLMHYLSHENSFAMANKDLILLTISSDMAHKGYPVSMCKANI